MEYCEVDRKNSNVSLARKYNTLNKFYAVMIAKEYLDMKNPMDKVERIKARGKVRGHVTLDEYKKIMSVLEREHDLRGLALFSLLFSSGIRLSEVFQLDKKFV